MVSRPTFYTLFGFYGGSKRRRHAVAMTEKGAVEAVLKKFPDFDIRDIQKGMIESESHPPLENE